MVRVRVLGRLEVTGDDGRPLGAERLPRRARQVLEVLAARYDRVQSRTPSPTRSGATSCPATTRPRWSTTSP
jgi:hypothetical protein